MEEENARLSEQIIELEDECQILDDKNSRFEVQLNAMRTELQRDREQRELEEDDNRRQTSKQVREICDQYLGLKQTERTNQTKKVFLDQRARGTT